MFNPTKASLFNLDTFEFPEKSMSEDIKFIDFIGDDDDNTEINKLIKSFKHPRPEDEIHGILKKKGSSSSVGVCRRVRVLSSDKVRCNTNDVTLSPERSTCSTGI
jgi:hypothetical protein